MTTRVSVRAQAKLNLWLHVMAREESGYHTIETLFHRIELADDVVVTLAPPGERTITCSEDVGPAQENLAYRAAQLYCGTLDWPSGFKIEIFKRIPARGGLGGGSADAAATLQALNVMSPTKLNDLELSELGAQLGADVPFLLADAPKALAWGRGDRMLKLAALPQRHVALVVPPFGISTANAFNTFHFPNRHLGQLVPSDLTDWGSISHLGQNSLRRALAVVQQPRVAEAVSTLRSAGALMADMTGSGSVVFGIFDEQPDAEALALATGCAIVLTRTALNVEAVRLLD